MSDGLSVMSFNLRYGTADDGPNQWSRRRDLVCETIDRLAPDVLGTQEALEFQFDFLQQQLPLYKAVGVGRDDGVRRGEFAAVFFRAERFWLVDSGHFWLSQSPEVAGSKSWGASQARMVTWCRLQDRRRAAPVVELAGAAASSEQSTVTIFNTHFDQRSEPARCESACLLRERIDTVTESGVIVTGDFNTTEDSRPYEIFVRGESPRSFALIDSYRAAHPDRDEYETTHHEFGSVTRGSRIDWILHSRHFVTQQAAIERIAFDGRVPSDHHPVTARLQWAGRA